MFKVGDNVKTREVFPRSGVIKSYIPEKNQFMVYMCDMTGCHTIAFDVGDLELAEPLIPVTSSEDIEKPKRYNKKGKLECWDVILDQEMDFLEGNIFKYIWRYKEKDGVKDLQKAKIYLDKLIERESKK
jgi:hypothetical protein